MKAEDTIFIELIIEVFEACDGKRSSKHVLCKGYPIEDGRNGQVFSLHVYTQNRCSLFSNHVFLVSQLHVTVLGKHQLVSLLVELNSVDSLLEKCAHGRKSVFESFLVQLLGKLFG